MIPFQINELKSLLQKCGSHSNLVNQILACSITLGIPQHIRTTRFVDAYAQLNNVVEVQKLFGNMSHPNVGSWTTLQNLYLRLKQPLKALVVFSKLISSGVVKPNSHSLVASLSACARRKDLINGRVLHGMVYKYIENATPSLHNALIDMYGKNGRIKLAERVFDEIDFRDIAIWTSLVNGYIFIGDMDSAKELFDKMSEKNVVSWTSMIVGYVRNNKPVEALELFMKMRQELGSENCCPTTFTIVAMLSGCADVGALNLGGSIHAYVNKRAGFVLDVTVNNGLIDMYGKSGDLYSAVRLFENLRRKDLFSWTSMISCLAINGKGKPALLIFDSMLKSGIRANEVTYVAVLSACSHAGLVDEGEKCFQKFVNSYGMKPKIEHFGCMVDLYVRAGLLEKALTVIEDMPMKPDAVIWRSILGACVARGNLELAEFAGKRALELEPEDDAVHVLLLSLYMSRNMRDDALKAMKMMRDKRIKKTPGCSWTEVNGIVCEFVAEASPYHMNDEMVFVLDGLFEHSKSDINSLLLE